MPVKSCSENNKSGYKWGDSGSCYTYNPNDKKSRETARRKAIKQGVAITISEGEKFTTNDKIVCEKCGWSWKISDGGNDLYICHKCGYDNKVKFATIKTDSSCPKATQDIPTNLANRQKAIDKSHYGPLDPNLPNNDYWNRKAKMFNDTQENARKAICSNCAFFNISKKIEDCIAKGIGTEGGDPYEVIDAGKIGYCEAWDFKCAGARTCDAWVAGGPVTMEEFAKVGERGGIKKSKKAPKSDTPNKNPQGQGTAKGKASSTRGAVVTKQVEETLRKKVDEFNDRYKEKLKYGVNIGMLKSVYQRGIGAYNVSHSPEVKSAGQWAYARVNAFLYLVKNGRPQNKKYTGDYDLLPKDHPKNTSK